jgi:hypothetical protein
MSAIIDEADNLEPRMCDTFVEYAQSRGFVIDAARIARPTDKALISHCTSSVASVGTCGCRVLGGLHLSSQIEAGPPRSLLSRPLSSG